MVFILITAPGTFEKKTSTKEFGTDIRMFLSSARSIIAQTHASRIIL
jgi:hypothetical protein